jgi:hypothetical protein
MFDRTEALFGSGRDFGDVGEQSVGVGAAYTSDLLYRVQVGEAPLIEDQVIVVTQRSSNAKGSRQE